MASLDLSMQDERHAQTRLGVTDTSTYWFSGLAAVAVAVVGAVMGVGAAAGIGVAAEPVVRVGEAAVSVAVFSPSFP